MDTYKFIWTLTITSLGSNNTLEQVSDSCFRKETNVINGLCIASLNLLDVSANEIHSIYKQNVFSHHKIFKISP